MRQILVRMRQDARSGRAPVSPAADATEKRTGATSAAAGPRPTLQSQSLSRSSWEPWLLPLETEDGDGEGSGVGASSSSRRKMLFTRKKKSYLKSSDDSLSAVPTEGEGTFGDMSQS